MLLPDVGAHTVPTVVSESMTVNMHTLNSSLRRKRPESAKKMTKMVKVPGVLKLHVRQLPRSILSRLEVDLTKMMNKRTIKV